MMNAKLASLKKMDLFSIKYDEYLNMRFFSLTKKLDFFLFEYLM